MTATEFNQAFHKLEVRPTSLQAAKMIGVSKRSVHYYSAGHTPIPATVAILLRLLVAIKQRGHRYPDSHAL